jgi:hypothetical protein
VQIIRRPTLVDYDAPGLKIALVGNECGEVDPWVEEFLQLIGERIPWPEWKIIFYTSDGFLDVEKIDALVVGIRKDDVSRRKIARCGLRLERRVLVGMCDDDRKVNAQNMSFLVDAIYSFAHEKIVTHVVIPMSISCRPKIGS